MCVFCNCALTHTSVWFAHYVKYANKQSVNEFQITRHIFVSQKKRLGEYEGAVIECNHTKETANC